MEILLSILVGTFTYLGFGYVVFEFLLGTYTKKHTLNLKGFNKPDSETSIFYLVVSCAAYAVLITLILYNWSTSLNAIDGFLVSGTIGSLVAIMANTFWHSSTYLYNSLRPLIADVVAAFITVGVLGGVIASILY